MRGLGDIFCLANLEGRDLGVIFWFFQVKVYLVTMVVNQSIFSSFTASFTNLVHILEKAEYKLYEASLFTSSKK